MDFHHKGWSYMYKDEHGTVALGSIAKLSVSPGSMSIMALDRQHTGLNVNPYVLLAFWETLSTEDLML